MSALPGRVWRMAREYVGARRRLRSLRGAALSAWQERHAVLAARHALAHSPFWQARAAGLRPEDWRRFPVIEKADVMAAFDAFNTAGLRADEATAFARELEAGGDMRRRLRGLTVGMSSGTSGHRTLTVLDADEQAGFVGFMLARMFDGGLGLRRHRVAFFMRTNSPAYEASRSPLIDFRFFDLRLTDAELIERLGQLDPDIVLGPPAMLGVIADHVRAGRLRLRPRLVLSVAEVLEPQQRAAIEGALGVTVRDVYHTSEGLIGVACREGRMHIQEDITVVELEPLGDGRAVPVQTQLFRRVLPFLRYRMNDVVVLDERPCPCGSAFRVIARVEGRCDDVFHLQADDGGLRRVFPDTLRSAVLASDGVREYRVEQRGPSDVRVALEEDRPGAVDVEQLVRGLVARLQAHGCAPPRVEVVHGIDDDTRGRKLVRVRRLWQPPPSPTSLSFTQEPAP